MKKVVLGCFLLLMSMVAQAADKVVVMATVSDLPSFCDMATKIAELSNDNQVKASVCGMKIFTQQKPFTDAVDVSRPLGLVGVVNDSQHACGVLVIPLKDRDAFFRMAENYAKREEIHPDTWKFSSECCGVFVRQVGTWLLASDGEENLRADLDGAKLEKLFLEQAKSCDLGLTLFVNEIPQEVRKGILNSWVACLRTNMGRKEGTTSAVAEKVEQLLQEFLDKAEAAQYVCPADQLTLKWNWDEKTQALTTRLEVTAPEGSSAARALHTFASASSSMLGVFLEEKVGFSSLASLNLPFMKEAWVGELYEAHLKDRIAKIQKKVKTEEKAKQIEAFIKKHADLWREAFLSVSANEGFQLILTEEDAFLLWGRSVPDGYALEEPFQQIVQYVKENKAEECKKHFLSATSRKEGDAHFYEAVLAPENKCPLPFFKEGCPVCVVFTPQAVYYAIGKDASARLEKHLKSGKTAVEVPAYQVSVRLPQILDAWRTYTLCDEQRQSIAAFQEKCKVLTNATVTFTMVPVTNGAAIEFQLVP